MAARFGINQIAKSIRSTFIALFLIIALFGNYVVFIVNYGVNTVFNDSWDIVPELNFVNNPISGFLGLFSVHYENIMPIPRVINSIFIWQLSFNQKYIMYLSCAILTLSLVAIYRFLLSTNKTNTNLWQMVPIAMLIFDLSQWQNTIWAFQMAWYLDYTLVIIALCLLIMSISHSKYLFLASWIFGVLASLSAFTGFLYWPIAIIIVLVSRMPKKRLIVSILSTVVAATGYWVWTSVDKFEELGVSNSHVSASLLSFSVHHIFNAIGFLLVLSGNVALGNSYTSVNVLVYIVGAVLFMAELGLLFSSTRYLIHNWDNTPQQKIILLGISLILVTVLSQLTASFARSELGTNFALTSRYTLFGLEGLIGSYLIVLANFQKSSLPGRRLKVSLSVVVGLIMVIYALSIYPANTQGSEFAGARMEGQTIVQNSSTSIASASPATLTYVCLFCSPTYVNSIEKRLVKRGITP